ncbi:GAF domain-containing sensor histidine kinase [Nostoc sp. ChiVER01]|uniref:GAF domain-containing sensor histidine kinase n=1 Tax=Nostoc sp. ChiVER01 TaxID=3075382 RepID=UPI002AD5035E|nr:GAF domain-containing sensor histidine kinase [Nostoc sp. ChiVER01]MDZ8224913.1 GAF domain-containing sensor histidine kinase [Nostoc sp. ChiVER01]
MNEIILTKSETLRLQALYQYNILDTIYEAAFDDLTRLAAQICGTPIALISLVDESRQWFKSKVGLDSESSSRDLAFCAHAILQPHETLIISDTLLDPRFATNPLVTSDPCIRFYAGAPLITPEGYALGTLCVIDHVPRQMNSEQLEALQALSRQVMAQMELKRNIYNLERITNNKHKQIEYLISALSHDLRTPLLGTRGTLYAMLGGAFGSVSDTWRDVLEDCRQANEDLLKFVEALLNVSRYKIEVSKTLKCEIINWKTIFVETILRSNCTCKQKSAIRYKIASSLPIVYGNALEIQRVIQIILDNAVKVNNPDQEITLEVALFGVEKVKISVRSNAWEIAPLDNESLFSSFIQGRGRNNIDKLGLYLCFQIVEAHKGTINIESTVEDTTFWFTLPVTY